MAPTVIIIISIFCVPYFKFIICYLQYTHTISTLLYPTLPLDKTLNLKTILIDRMVRLSPAEFEKIIHPIFQEGACVHR